MKNILTALTFSLTLLASVTPVAAVTISLYDGGASGLRPENYNVPQYSPPARGLSFTNLNLANPFQVASRSSVNNVNSTASNNIYAGFGNYDLFGNAVNTQFPALDRNNGYVLNFAVQIISESSTRPERAGFSLLVNSSDVAPGVATSVEIAFQTGRIFAQNQSFTNPTDINDISSFNPVGAGFVNYSLQVSGNSFTLTANGAPLLINRPLRDYTSFSGFGSQAYQTPSGLAFGDNTTSAQANFNIGAVSLVTNSSSVAAVPYEFSPTIGLLTLGAFATISYLKKRQT